MHPSHFAGALVLAGATLLFGCEQTAKKDAANTNQPESYDQSAATPAPAPEMDEKAVGGFTGPQIALAPASPAQQPAFMPPENTEKYLPIDSNPVRQVAEQPVSTFSVDVDSGSYANIRRFLMQGQKPPQDAVRVEEMVNYFSYDYPGPDDASVPFKTTTHVTRTPWNPDTYLLEIGIKGYQPSHAKRPPANLVFLIDVSGSMDEPDKLPLLKSGMHLLVDRLR